MTNEQPKPWTLLQFQAAMRRAGWVLKDLEYRHEDGGRFSPYTWRAGEGYAWAEWARKRETPATDKVNL
jgi:hypothetical protein